MRRYFNIFYWAVVVLLLSGVFISIAKDYFSSLLLSVTILPGVIFAKFFWADISFKNRLRGVYHLTLLAIIILVIEYLAILIFDIYFFNYGLGENVKIIFNPFFIWLLTISLLSVERLIEIKIDAVLGEDRPSFIEFISDRKRVSLAIESITFIESMDDEVWVRTTSDVSYRTKMNISHWQMVLDDRFVRIHRAFLVNKSHISKKTPSKLWIGTGGKSLEISRKYREQIL